MRAVGAGGRVLACLAVMPGLAPHPAFAQTLPSQAELAGQTAKRFPQSVHVGDLLHRLVQKPLESHDYVGRVDQVVRGPDRVLRVVLQYGGVLGVGSHAIAVPIDAMVIVGQVMEIVGLTPAQLATLPAYRKEYGVALPADAVVEVGLGKPAH